MYFPLSVLRNTGLCYVMFLLVDACRFIDFSLIRVESVDIQGVSFDIQVLAKHALACVART